VDEEKLDEIKGEAKEYIDEVVRFADESEQPPLGVSSILIAHAGEDEYMGER